MTVEFYYKRIVICYNKFKVNLNSADPGAEESESESVLVLVLSV